MAPSTLCTILNNDQVRKIVGGLIAVGNGSITMERLKEVLDLKDPSIAPPMAPACGLYFHKADYEPYKILESSDQDSNEKKRKREEPEDPEGRATKMIKPSEEKKQNPDEE